MGVQSLCGPELAATDLGATKTPTNIEIDWEDANAANYLVLGSTNGTAWTSRKNLIAGTFGHALIPTQLKRHLPLSLPQRHSTRCGQ